MMNPLAVFFTRLDLQDVNTRARLLMPPMALLVVFAGIAFGYLWRGTTAPAYVFWLYLVCAGYLLVGVLVVMVADHRHAQKKQYTR